MSLTYFPNSSFPLGLHSLLFGLGPHPGLLQQKPHESHAMSSPQMECQLTVVANCVSMAWSLLARAHIQLPSPAQSSEPRLWFPAYTELQLFPLYLSIHHSPVSSPPDSHVFTFRYDLVEMLESQVAPALFYNSSYEIILECSQCSLSLPSDHSAVRTLLTLAPRGPGRTHGTWCVFCRCWTESSWEGLSLFCRN